MNSTALHDAADRSPASAALAELQALLARAEAAQNDVDLAAGLALARRAWALAADAEAPLRRRAGLLLSHFLYRSGAVGPVVEQALEILPLLRASGPTTELIDLLRKVALCGADASRFEVALASAQEALRLAVEIGDAARVSLSTNALGCIFERSGDPWQGERLLLEALAQGRGLADTYPAFVALNNLGAVLIGKFYLLRDAAPLDEAREPLQSALPHAREAVELARSRGEAFFLVCALGNLGEILVHLGQAGPAQAALDEAAALARAGGFAAQVWRIGCSVGELQLLHGQAQAAWDTLSDVLAACGDGQQPATQLRLHHALSQAAQALGRSDDALAHLRQHLRLERQRAVTQLQAQSELFVTRVEAERMRREAERHHARARALEADMRRDELTGLGNRREMEERWPQLLAQVRASGGPLAVAMLDLDEFKLVNDRHGHAVGDRVLAELAGLLRQHTRSGDLVVRLGGEEFLLVLPETGPERALEVCERLRQRVQGHDWERLSPGLRVTLSGGVTSAPPYDAATLSLRADNALYRAKAAGRNCIVQA